MYDSNPGETSRPRDFVTGSAATRPHGSLLRVLLRIMRGQLVASEALYLYIPFKKH